MQGTGHQMAIRVDSPVPATTKGLRGGLQCCCSRVRKRKGEAHIALSDLQLLVVLAQLISTPRSAPHLPTSAFFWLARPSSIQLDRIFCLPVCRQFQPHAGKRAKRRRRRTSIRKPPGSFAAPDYLLN